LLITIFEFIFISGSNVDKVASVVVEIVSFIILVAEEESEKSPPYFTIDGKLYL